MKPSSSKNFFEDVCETLELERDNILGCPISEAAKVVQGVVGKLVKKANMPEEIAQRYVEFAKDEGLLYSYEAYRDHFFHPFLTFLLGFRLLQLGRSENIHDPPFPLTDDFLNKWLLTSLWHDINYAAAKGPEWLSAFIEERIGVKIKASQDWSPLMEKGEVITALEDLKAEFAKSDTQRKLIFHQWLHKQLLQKHDHGVLSGVILLIRNKSWKWNNSWVRECALAIALHNFHSAYSGDEDKGVGKDESPALQLGKINIEEYPLGYLLVYCDTAQEWGRPANRHDPTICIDYGKLEIDKNKKLIEINLNYDPVQGKKITKEIKDEEEAKLKKPARAWKRGRWKFLIQPKFR